MMHPVVLVTATSYKSNSEADRLRSRLAVDLVKKATSQDYPIIVVDGGSLPETVEQLKQAGARIFGQQSDSMGGAIREAIQEGLKLDPQVIFWTEPEKVDVVKNIDLIVRPILRSEAEMVVPKRRDLKSYPKFQQHSETLINLFWETLTKTALDISFGPKVFKKNLAQYYLEYQGGFGDRWEELNLPLARILNEGHKIKSIEVDYTHPIEQSNLEDMILTL